MDPGWAAFAERLRALRQDSGLSQRRLARAVHVDHAVVSRAEHALRRPDPELAQRLDAVLGSGDELRTLALTARAHNTAPASDGLPRAAARRTRPLRTLPPDTRHFVGRERQLDRIRAFLADSPDLPGAARVCVISAMPGLGKTALAVHAAHLFAARFPDGCAFLDLHGFAPGQSPINAFDALGALLDMLGVPPGAVPRTVQARAARFQAETAETRLLFVLDDAASAEQLRLLLPAAASCRVLVTSRNRLAALDDAQRLSLPVLGDADSAALFRAVSGRRDFGAGTADSVAAFCAGVPLALRIAAARCRDDSLSAESLVEELARADDRAARLDDGERSVRGAFAVSFAALPVAERRMFTLLGLHPPTVFDTWAAAALAGLTHAQAARLLEHLDAANLLQPQGPDLHRMHDLIAGYAASAADRSLSMEDVRLALGRVLDRYLIACHAADLLVTPHRHRFTLGYRPDPAAPRFEGYDDARVWLVRRLDTLAALCETAYQRGFDEHCWQLAYTLRGIFFLGKHWTHWERTHAVALAAARRLGDPGAEAATLNNLGLLMGERGQGEAARMRLGEAIAVCRAHGDRYGEHTARSHRAWLLHSDGRYEEAWREQAVALDFHRETGSRRNAAIILRDMAATELELGRVDDAFEHLKTAEREFAELGLLLDRAMALNALGEVCARVGDAPGAERHHHAALRAARRSGSVYEQARAHRGLGGAAAEPERPARCRHLTRALRLFESLGAQKEAERVQSAMAAAGCG